MSPRVGALISHGEKVRDLLRAANGPQGIIASSIDVVATENPTGPPLSPEQMATWQKLLPILAEHGLLAVRGGSPVLATDKPMGLL